MPRAARVWSPEATLHGVIRAHEGRPIFVTRDDRLHFLDRMERAARRTRITVYGWGLQVNHAHLLFGVGDTPPGEFFRALNTPVAMRARRLRGDHGAVLQDRYWSSPCTGDGSIVSALVYVTGNPVHHGVVPSAEALESYEWSAYGALLSLAPAGVVDVAAALRFFHDDPAIARASLRAAMRCRTSQWHAEVGAPDEEPPRDAWIFGPGPGGVRGAGVAADCGAPPSACASLVHDARLAWRSRLAAAGWRIEDLLVSVCPRFGAAPERVAAGCRARPEAAARAVVAYVACDIAGETSTAAARLLGVSVTAVVLARRRGQALVASLGWDPDAILAVSTGCGS